MQRGTERGHAGVLEAIDGCIALAEEPRACDAFAGDLSRWSVGEHLEHLLLADDAIVGWLDDVGHGASSSAPRGRPTFLGALVLRTGFIPRGRGRAPDLTRPAGLSSSEIEAGFRRLRQRYEALGALLPSLAESRSTTRHPVLGQFTPAQWLRLIHVHHLHHEKIVRDILRAGQAA